MDDMRRAIGDRLRSMVGSGTIDLSRPPGDDGLFASDSIAWKVHGDFTAMMVGGVAALLIQMLHPGALAGVWDHSDFHRDMAGRLRRTASFIAVTTYGSTATADAMIARVRAIHDQVTGTLPDGTPYSANDADLLLWVHAAETWAFLAAYRRYRAPAMPLVQQDRYVAEAAVVAERLGVPASDIPRSRAALDAYMRRTRPALRHDARTAMVARALLRQPPSFPAMAPAQAMLMQGGVDLLPDWAATLHRLPRPGFARPAVRMGVRGVGKVLRWALKRV